MTTKRVTDYSISLLELIIRVQGFIVDIDDIQAHGMYSPWNDVSLMSPNLRIIGVGAADITKLKANGYYTVAVSTPFLESLSDVRTRAPT